MRLVLTKVEACEERGVEEGGCVLADPTADRGVEHAVHDHPCVDEAIGAGSSPDIVVDRELPAGFDDRTSGEFGDSLNVDDTGLAGDIVRGELADEFLDLE